MADAKTAGMISGMDPLNIIDGTEQLEVIKRAPDGTLKNFRVLMSKVRTNTGLSAYEVAVKNGFTGTEPEWLASLKGKSAFQLATELGFTGTEEEWLESLVGASAYDAAVADGYDGTQAQWLESLKGKSAYDLAKDLGFVGTEAEWLTSIKGEKGDKGDNLTDEGLQELLNLHGYTVKDLLRVLGDNSGLSANAGFFNFLFAFDKRLKNEDNTSPEKVPQRSLEMGRLEAEGFSYWKNSSATASTGKLPEVPDSEVRLYDDGRFQIGSATDYIQLGEGGKISIVKDGVTKQIDLEEPAGVSGGVFITDVTALQDTDNVGEMVRSEDGYSVIQASTTAQVVRVEVLAITGHTNVRPKVTVNDQAVPLQLFDHLPCWKGVVEVPVQATEGEAKLKAVHEDGAKSSATLTIDTKPAITEAIFNTNYPGTQTELKKGDKIGVRVTSDQPITAWEIQDTGALQAVNGTVANPSTTINLTDLLVADRGNTASLVGFQVRVKKASGAWSPWFNSSAAGNAEKLNVVKLNNLMPTATFGTITYPAGQTAIKEGESATVAIALKDADSVAFESPTQELTIARANVIEDSKQVTYLAGTQNVDKPNVKVTATRSANGAVTVTTVVVHIVADPLLLDITYPAARLRSGGNNGTDVQRHLISIKASQGLSQAPTLTPEAGTWENAPWVSVDAEKTVWTRGLMVSDADAKGEHGFTNVSAQSVSGKTTKAINSGAKYTLGGFVKRVFSCAAYPNRQAAIGTKVTDTSKLQCSNLSKGQSGSLNFAYKADQTAEVGKYTILNDDTWYNCDSPNATSNTTGAMRIELEELA